MDWQAIVGDAIQRRKEQRLTQKQLAVLAGVSAPTVNNLEAGKTTLSVENVLKILKVLGLSSTGTKT